MTVVDALGRDAHIMSGLTDWILSYIIIIIIIITI